MQSLCTLRVHCRQWPRNTHYQAGATPYLGRTFTGWIAPACGWRTHSITSSVRASSVAGTSSPCDHALKHLHLLDRLLALVTEVQQQRLHKLLVQQVTRAVPVAVRVALHSLMSISNRGVAAVDQEIGAGHERRLLAGEVHRASGDLVRHAKTADKRVVRGARGVQCVEVAQVTRGLYRSRRQAVDAYILPGMVKRHRLGQLDQRALGGAVPRPPRTRDASELRGDQDDASAATRFHGRDGVLAEQESAIEIDRHGTAPVSERQA